MVFQEHSVFPWLTVKQNIEFVLKTEKYSDIVSNRLLNELLEVTELEPFQEYFPKNLSAGMKQRLSIAMVLASNSKIILMDEPFASLDLITREKMQEFKIDFPRPRKPEIKFSKKFQEMKKKLVEMF